MQLTVIHDANGNIFGATAHPPDTPPSGPVLKPGQYATEVEVPEIAADLDPGAMLERVSEMVAENLIEVVEVKSRKGKLKLK